MCKNKIRITFCMYRLDMGGIETCLLRILKELCKKNIYDLRVVSIIKGKKYYINFFHQNNIKYAYKDVKHSFFNKICQKNAFEKLLHSSDIIVDYFDCSYSDILNNYNAVKIGWWHRNFYNFMIRKSDKINDSTYDKIVCLTDYFLKCASNSTLSYKDKFIRIYNPFNIEYIQNQAKEACQNTQDKYFCYVGRVQFDKDFGTLISAFNIFSQQNTDARLLIIGDGPERAEYENLVKLYKLTDKVIFMGAMINPLGYMKNAIANILVSHGEALPNTLIEAQILEVLAICSDCPDGPREILQNGASGVLFPASNSIELAKIMDKVWKHHQIYQKQICEASNGLYRFDYKNILPQIEQMFLSLHNITLEKEK